MESETWKPAWHIASYPRSGNHLIRAILEAASGRPTIGCPYSGDTDLPIHLRAPNRKLNLIAIHDSEPIGYKSHQINQIMLHCRAAQRPLGFLLVTRNPVHAISSHLARKLRRSPFMSAKARRLLIEAQVDMYLGLVMYFASEPKNTKMHLRFEDMISKEWTANHLDNLVETLTGVQAFADIDRTAIFKLAKESQESLNPRRAQIQSELADLVSNYLTYDDVMEIINRHT